MRGESFYYNENEYTRYQGYIVDEIYVYATTAHRRTVYTGLSLQSPRSLEKNR